MKIGINAQNLSFKHLAGPELYTLNVIKALNNLNSSVAKQHNYEIYIEPNLNNQAKKVFENLSDNFKVTEIKKLGSWTQVSLAKHLIKTKPHIFFTPIHTIPIIRPEKTKFIAMIHGLEFETNDTSRTLFQKLLSGKPEQYVCKNADKIIVPSENVQNDIIEKCEQENWQLKNNDIKIIREGVDEKFQNASKFEVKRAQSKFDLFGKDYLIFISTVQPRKNLAKLIHAVAILNKDYGKNLHLAVCGKLGWGFEKDLLAPEKHKIKDLVKFLGRVSDADLIALLSGASAYVSSSVQEGFGLPLLEALACETLSAVSDIPSYKEIGEDVVEYFNMNEPNDIAEKINLLLELDSLEAERRVKKGKELANNYSWEKTAQSLLKVFENVSKK